MNLIEQIQIGEELISKCKSQGKNFKSLETKVQGLKETFHRDIEQMKLSELKDRVMAIQIYSDVLCSEIWFCNDEECANQIKQDVPDSICYTFDELLKIIELNPDSEALRTINTAKSVFQGSYIIKVSNFGGAF